MLSLFRSSFLRPRSFQFTRLFSVNRNNLSGWASHTFGNNDTIYALSSAFGRAGVSVVRISGPRATEVFNKMTLPSDVPKPRTATYRRLLEPPSQTSSQSRDEIDRIIALYFKAPHSVTGEDVVELHIHGSLAVIDATLNSLASLDFGMAQPGEFIRRAFHSGKMDLSSVEGVGDLINAETKQQRKQALSQMDGKAEKKYTSWATALTSAVAKIEAIIDFGEDAHIDNVVVDQAKNIVLDLIKEIGKHLSDGHRGEMVRSGVQIAIIGPTNAGKSSLLNILAKKPAAIVSPQKGTTRDVIEVAMDIGGYPVKVCDTAGINDEATDQVEIEGINRSKQR